MRIKPVTIPLWKCERCGLCCQSIVPVFDEELSSVPEQYRICEHLELDGVAVDFWTMRMQESGYCAAYNDGRCDIYENRPMMCSIFECSHDPQLRQSQALDLIDAAALKKATRWPCPYTS